MTIPVAGKSFDVTLELDEPRLIKIDFNTLCRAGEATGINFLNMTAELDANRLRALLWAGLQYEEGETHLTLDEVGLLVGEHFVEVMLGVLTALEKAMPKQEEQTGEPENPLETATAPS